MTAKNSINLGGVFYAPNYNHMLPLMIEAKTEASFGMDAYKIVGKIVEKYYQQYAETNQYQGFNLERMLEEANIFCKLVKLYENFKREFSGTDIGIDGVNKLHYCGVTQLYKPTTCNHADESVFAVAIGTDIIATSDKDCYETAGGYRYYETAENPIVYLSIGHWGITLKFESWLIVDHYNNNICGNPTSNGTITSKKEGATVTRVINTKCYDLGKVLKEYNLSLKKMDCSRGTKALEQYNI